jgi:hypothetical protein
VRAPLASIITSIQLLTIQRSWKEVLYFFTYIPSPKAQTLDSFEQSKIRLSRPQPELSSYIIADRREHTRTRDDDNTNNNLTMAAAPPVVVSPAEELQFILSESEATPKCSMTISHPGGGVTDHIAFKVCTCRPSHSSRCLESYVGLCLPRRLSRRNVVERVKCPERRRDKKTEWATMRMGKKLRLVPFSFCIPSMLSISVYVLSNSNSGRMTIAL